MKSKYFLLLGAASMMMFAGCTEKFNREDTPEERGLSLKALSSSEQAGRVARFGTRAADKAHQLKLVAKIAPVKSAAEHNWSATGIAIANGKAYVSWHSNHQASVAATEWGGAVDVIDINALLNRETTVIEKTYESTTFKFNGVVAGGGKFYFPIASYKHGALVGYWDGNAEKIDTIAIAGSSANSIAVKTDGIYAVSGYEGGLYRLPLEYSSDNTLNVPAEVIAYSDNFGGKYVDGDYVLRTNDAAMLITDFQGNPRNEGAPLVSSEKKTESRNLETGAWEVNETAGAKKFYGKHTMAVAGDYIYVGGGKGNGAGKNGLRVYSATSQEPVWENGTTTIGVCVSDKFVFAATGAGLRVYKKFDGTDMPLFAYEVINYNNETGEAEDYPGSKTPMAGTEAQSNNFVAYDAANKLVFVACGQTGVYVFRLETTLTTGLKYADKEELEEVEVGTTKDFTIPAATVAGPGKDFDYWQGSDGGKYTPGATVTLPAGTIIKLKAIEKNHVYPYTLKFDGNRTDATVGNVPGELKSDEAVVEIPTKTPSVPEYASNNVFIGWVTEAHKGESAKTILEHQDYLVKDTYTFTAEGVVTLYAIWGTQVVRRNTDVDITFGGNHDFPVE